MKKEFTLWLEFEAMDPSNDWDADNEFFNMHIHYLGKKYALNVWSYGFTANCLSSALNDEESYVRAPDLLVRTCTRAHMEAVVAQLIENNGPEPEWLVIDD